MPRVRESLAMRIAIAAILKARRAREALVQVKASFLEGLARGYVMHGRIEAAKQENFSKYYHCMRGGR